ncbi:MAG: protease modulator HflC [Rhodanobacteraceae bacterium]
MKIAGAVIVLLLLLAGVDSLFVVREGQGALLLQFGNIVESGFAPGLHFKWPFAQQVGRYDTRAIVLESEPDRYQTSDGAAMQASFHARWRVVDPMAYYRATGGDELQASQQITPLIRDALRSEIQAHKLGELIDGNGAMDTRARTLVDNETRARLGVAILDIGIERLGPPDEAADAVYNRMRANAKSDADALRAAGEEKAAVIKADDERKKQTLLADAQKAADTARGAGDAQAAKIHADTAAQDPQFFAFWSSLQAYRKAFGNGRTVIVLEPDSPFLKEFSGNPANAPAAKAH